MIVVNLAAALVTAAPESLLWLATSKLVVTLTTPPLTFKVLFGVLLPTFNVARRSASRRRRPGSRSRC